MNVAIDQKEIDRLRKIEALTRSPSLGEAQAATDKLKGLLKRQGKTLADLPEILNPPQASPINKFADFADWMETKEPGYKEQAAAAAVDKAKKDAAYRRKVIAKYGSEENAKAATPMERAVDEAVKPFAKRMMFKYSNGTFPTDTLDGWTGTGPGGQGIVPPPEHVCAAIHAALPLPITIAEAKAEYDAWRERDKELEAILGRGGDTWLSIGCKLREDIICEMLLHELRAVSLEDAIVRHRAIDEAGSRPSDRELAAMLADLEHLAAQAKAGGGVQTGQQTATVQSGHLTATARRDQVRRLLADPETARLSDREIARRVGVSPQTVGNIRRTFHVGAHAREV